MPLAPQHLRTFFITTTTASRRRLFQVHQNATLLIEILELQRQQNRIQLHAFVIMPDHIHLLLTPTSDLSLEKAMQYIKGSFSFRLKDKLDVWQRSYTNHCITRPDDYTHPRRLHSPQPR
jgi:putative transposase